MSDLFDLERIGDRFSYDPVAILLPRPDTVRTWRWDEHPRGHVVLRTNNLGFREDLPTEIAKRGIRILVAGDSHTAGVVDNAESFANVLEARLQEGASAPVIEVLNAGVAYTGPYCYLGVLRRYLFLKPDVFVAVLFTGNDFWDDLKVRYHLDGWSPPVGDAAYVSRIREAAERWPGPVSQGFNQAYRWKNFPDEAELSLDAVVHSYLAMQELCERNGIDFLAVVLPTKMDVDGDDDLATRESVRDALGLGVEETRMNRRLGERFIDALQASGVRWLDPTRAMLASPTFLYWRRDYHLNLDGHALLAELLEGDLRRRL